MNKRIWICLMAMFLLFGIFSDNAEAADTGDATDGYQLLSETEDYIVYTKSVYPWTESNGVYTSGNKGIGSSSSNLKIVFKKDGVVSFDWSVSYTSKSAFAYQVGADYETSRDISNSDYRYSGDKQGREQQLTVVANDALYMVYYKLANDSSATAYTDTATISNLKLSPIVEGGDSVVDEFILYDSTMGNVAVDRMEKRYNSNNTTYFEVVASDAETVEVGKSYRLKATAKDDYQFYGWVKEYTYNGVEYKEFLPLQYYTLGTGTADNGATINTKVRVKNPELEVTFDGKAAYRAVFAPAGTYALRVNAEFYENNTDLASVIKDTTSGDVVEILKDVTLTKNATVPKGVLLYVPFRSGWSEDDQAGKYREGGFSGYNATTAIDNTNHYVTLTVDDGVTLTVNGKIGVGSVISYNSQRYQGHISGSHGRIVNNGNILVNSGGTMTCYGLVEGAGIVHIDDDAILKEMFVIGDFAGGNNSAQLYFTEQMPFKRFSVQNVQCVLEMESNSQLVAMAHVWASSMYNEAEVVLFGNHSKAAFCPNEGLTDTVSLTRTYSAGQSLTDGNGLLDVTGIGRTEWTFSAGLSFQPFVVNLGIIELDTSRSDFTIPYNFKIKLIQGTYNIPIGMRIMPGAEVVVESGASVNIGGRLMVMDGLVQTDMSTDRYPNCSELIAAGFSSSGELTINGTLTMQNGSTLGGLVKNDGTGKLVISDNVYLNNSGDMSKLNPKLELRNHPYDQYTAEGGVARTINGETVVSNWVQQDGAKGTYDENTTWFNLPARIYMDGELQKVEAGKTYLASALETAETVNYDVTYLYVADGVYGSIGGGKYGYKTASGDREMISVTENVTRVVNGSWVDSEGSQETVEVKETSVAGISTADITCTKEKSGTSTLLKDLQVVDEKTGEAKTEKYVFLVKYTVEGNTDGITVPLADGVYTIPPEADGVKIEAALLGDVNLGGTIGNNDGTLILWHTAGKKMITNELALLAADTNGGGTIGNNDGTLILWHTAGKKLLF